MLHVTRAVVHKNLIGGGKCIRDGSGDVVANAVFSTQLKFREVNWSSRRRHFVFLRSGANDVVPIPEWA